MTESLADVTLTQGDMITDPSLYTLKDLNKFLDETYRRPGVNLIDFFPDREKFVAPVSTLQKAVC